MDLLRVNIFLALFTFACGFEWWNHAVIYQVYPRSFYDSDGDGIGDIPGIINKANYFKELDVDAVLLAPMYKSPQKDFGYDVSDFKAIDPIFGTFTDWLNLVKILHDEGIKIIMDFIPNHTSKEHPWFKQALANDPKYINYYIWRNGASTKSGKPAVPNNWISVYGGPSWTWASSVNKYYYHHFLPDQPDLNLNNSEVIEELKEVLMFWMFYGVDGFRVNSAFALFEDPNFSNEKYNGNCTDELDYDCYTHAKTAEYKDNFHLLIRLRQFIDTVPLGINALNDTRLFITDSYSNDFDTLKYYQEYNNKRIADFPINYSFITKLNRGSRVKEWVDVIKMLFNKGIFPNWMLGNHDNSRVANRLGRELVDSLNMLVLLLKGTVLTYNGEEIGMRNSYIRWDQAKDPKGIIAGQEKFQEKSRDPERGPFQWNDSLEGFSNNSNSWLPLGSNFWKINLKSQNSTITNRTHLNIYKLMIQLRKTDVLKRGSCEVETIDDEGDDKSDILAVYRFLPDNPTIFGLFNFGTFPKVINIQKHRDFLPSKLYLFSCSLNIEEGKDKGKMGSIYNSSEITIPPKGAMIFSTQDFKIPIKADSNTVISFM